MKTRKSDWFNRTTIQLVEKVGVLGKSFGKITLLKKEPAHKYYHRDVCKHFTHCDIDSRSTRMGNQVDSFASL